MDLIKLVEDYRKNYLTICKKYYNNESDILNKQRLVQTKEGLMVLEILSNSQINTGLFRTLVDQKIDYLMSRPFIIEHDVNDLFTPSLRKKIKEVVKNSIIYGISFMYVGLNSKNELFFKVFDTNEVVPIWEDYERTKLKSLIRHYETLEGLIIYEHYEQSQLTVYSYKNGKLSNKKVYPYMIIHGEKGKYTNKILPFLPISYFCYNADRASLLSFVKNMLDDYELKISCRSDNIQDIPHSIKVVENYDGTDLQELIKNLAQYRIVKVSEGGSLYNLTTPIESEATEEHLKRIRKDLFTAGRGVDIQDEDFGNISGVALKFKYADLDLDCNNLENEVKESLQKVLEMVSFYLKLSIEPNTNIVFNRSFIANETELINNLRNSEGLISQETIIKNHPFVIDPEEELQKIKAEEYNFKELGI